MLTRFFGMIKDTTSEGTRRFFSIVISSRKSAIMPMARNVGQLDCRCTSGYVHRRDAYVDADGRKCSTKILEIPDTIGSSSRKHGKEYITLPPESIQTYPLLFSQQ